MGSAQYRSPESVKQRIHRAKILDQNRTPEEKAARAARAKERKFENELRKLNHLPRKVALKIMSEKSVIVKQNATEASKCEYSFC